MNKIIKLNGQKIVFDLNSVETPCMDYPDKLDDPLKWFFKDDRYLQNEVDYRTLKTIRIPCMLSKIWQVIIVVFDLSCIFHSTRKSRKSFQKLVASSDEDGNRFSKTLPGACDTWTTEYFHNKNGVVEKCNVFRPHEIDDADKVSEPDKIVAINCPDIDKTIRQGEIVFNEWKVKAAIHIEAFPDEKKTLKDSGFISKSLSKKRAKAAKQNRTVKDKGDRAKIKAAVHRKEKRGYSSNQAHEEVVRLCGSKENLLKLKEGPYPYISPRAVRRIAKEN